MPLRLFYSTPEFRTQAKEVNLEYIGKCYPCEINPLTELQYKALSFRLILAFFLKIVNHFLLQQSKEKVVVDTIKKPQPGTREYAAEDLQRLVKRPQDTEDPKIKEDLPPLLQVKTKVVQYFDQFSFTPISVQNIFSSLSVRVLWVVM